MDSWPRISIVVPIRNEAKFIAQTIQYLLAQDYPHDRMEILVAVGDSTDNTANIVKEIADREPRVRYYHNPKQWSSAARNIGALNATGDIITYIDGHTYIDNDQLLKNTALLMQERGVSVLSRPQFLDTPENDQFQKAVSLARKSKLGHGLDSTIYSDEDMYVNPASAGATYKREVFDRVGYFDESFDASEDYEFNYRVSLAGYKAFTSKKLAVYYYPRQSLGGLFKQMSRYGTGRMRLARKYSETLGIGTLIPVFFVAGLFVWLLALLTGSILAPLFTYAYAIYAFAALAFSAQIAFSNGVVYFFLCPPIYAVIHFGLGWGFMGEFLRGQGSGQTQSSEIRGRS